MQLKVSNNQIVSSNMACTVRLKGVDVSGLESSAIGDMPSGFPATVVSGTQMTDYVGIVTEAVNVWHANCIRFPLNQDYWFGCTNSKNNNYQPVNQTAYRDMIAGVVNFCNTNNVYVILDLHWSGTASSASAPCGSGWQTATAQQNMPDMNAVTFWSSLASVYANNPAVLFDLYNEPNDPTFNDTTFWSVWRNGGSTGGTPSNTPGLQTLLTTIRDTGANNVVVAGGLGFAYDLKGIIGQELYSNTVYALTDTGSGNGVVYAAHCYDMSANTGSSSVGTVWDPDVTLVTSQVPVIVSEFGPGSKYSSDDNNATWDNSALSWINGANDKSYVYSALAWCLSSDVGPTLLNSYSGYSTTNYHGAPVSTWLYNLNETPTPNCSGGGNTPTFTNTPTITPTPYYCPVSLVDDFENQSLNGINPARENLWGGLWGTTVDSNSAITVKYGVAGSGADSTSYSAEISGKVAVTISGPASAPTTTYGYSNYYCNLFDNIVPFNAVNNNIIGLELWLYGDGNTYRVCVQSAGVTDNNWYGENLTPPSGQWTFYQIAFSSMQRGQGWGTQTGLPATYGGTDMTGVQIAPQNLTGAATYSYRVDQVGFYCLAGMTATPTPNYCPVTVLDDFENLAMDGTSPARTNLWGGVWATVVDAPTTSTAGSSITVTYGVPGEVGNYGVSLAGVIDKTVGYSDYYTNLFSSGTPINLASNNVIGLEFWAYGDGHTYRAMVESDAVSATSDWYGVNFTPPNGKWAFYQISFSNMKQDGWGPVTTAPVTCDGTGIFGVAFATELPSAGGAFSYQLDQVGFYCLSGMTPTNSPTVTNTKTPTSTPTFTNTPTFTGTSTSTCTATDSPTSTPTNLVADTPTDSPTCTATNPSVSTDTATLTATNTATLTPTNTVTQTATNTATNTCTITGTIPPTDTPTITDTPSDTPTVTLTATVTSTYTATNSPTITNTLTATDTYTITNTPTNTFTFTSTMTVTPTYTFTNTPVFTNTFTITNTPTATSTYTLTNTPTDTTTNQPTSTKTGTPTATVTSTPTISTVPVVSNGFPNPSQGSPVTFQVQSPSPSRVVLEVFTLAFRKIATQNMQINGNQTIQWNLKDNKGVRVADGMYYVRIQITGSKSTTKVIKILVLK
jgi:hypothetical protein